MNHLRKLVHRSVRLLQLSSVTEVRFHHSVFLLNANNYHNAARKGFDGTKSISDWKPTSLRTFKTSSFVSYAKEEEAFKGEKVLRVKLATCRVDAVLKAGLNMSRNKLEKAFYEDRIRVNGERPRKKSQSVREGDEIDVVRGYNKLNPEFLDVNRVEVAEIKDDAEGSGSDASDSDDDSSKIPAVLKRSKMLTIENYSPPWKGTTADI